MAGIERPLLRVVSNTEYAAQQAAAVAPAQQAVLTGLAGHLRTKWEAARNAKGPVEERMRKSVRQRKGEYEPDKMAAIREQGGSEIYMMLTSVKCRAAASWLRDAITGTGSEKPWTASPTPNPELPNDLARQLEDQVGMEIGMMAAAGAMPPPEVVKERLDSARELLAVRLKEMAREKAQLTEQKLEDALLEGGFQAALDSAIDDLVGYPAAVIKGPIARREPRLAWVKRKDNTWGAEVQYKIVKTFHRVDPFNLYPMPWGTCPEDTDLFELHELTPSALYSMIGSPGYDETAIRAVIEKCKNGTVYTDWAGLHRVTAKEMNQPGLAWSSDRPIQALEYYGTVPGALLIEWGMTPDQVPDPEQQYNVNCWMIAEHVIKATINIDPLGAKPYSVASYETIPGSFWGNGVPDLIRDLQDMCNAAARSLVNNMAMSSGPMVWVNMERMAVGTKMTTLHPWKQFQGVNDPMGSTAPPIEFFQPDAQAAQLMGVFEFFSNLADEYSGIPKYMTGDGQIGGAGRTSSGLSMLMGNATKLMKQVLSGVDRVFESVLTRTHTFMLRYEPDADLEGDVRLVARGVNSVSARETMQLRRNEFLGMTANPFDMQIMGMPGRAYLLREQAKMLGMNTDQLVPDPEKLAMAQPMGQPVMPGQPGQPAVGQVPGQSGQPGTGGPADMSQRPPGAHMDRPRV